MAITVISVPSALSLAYRPMVYKFSSNATDLRYCIVEVFNNGVVFECFVDIWIC